MPKSCSVPYCTHRYNSKNKQLTFHRFPFSKPDLFKEWVGNVGRLNFKPKHHTVICSDHFTPDCFSAFGNRKNLMPDAIPTIFPFKKNVKGFKTAKNPLKEEDANTIELETVVDVENTATETERPTSEVGTVKEEKSRSLPLQTVPRQQREVYPLSVPDHSYTLVDCNALKKKLFLALEENEKLRKRVKVKSEELRRVSANLQAVKRELEMLKVRQSKEMGPDQCGEVTRQTAELQKKINSDEW